MKRTSLNIILLLAALCFNTAYGQQVHFEQYYLQGGLYPALSPGIISYKKANNWYAQVRFNYEEANTAAVYGGRCFDHTGILNYEVIPLLGAVMGRFNGGSAGVHCSMDYKRFFFSTQAQYTFSVQDHALNYIFNWSELAVETTPWLYAGIAAQQTKPFGQKLESEPGIVIGFSFRKFTFPIYIFKPRQNRPFSMIGFTWKWAHASSASVNNSSN